MKAMFSPEGTKKMMGDGDEIVQSKLFIQIWE
jgi:hypothetical protein